MIKKIKSKRTAAVMALVACNAFILILMILFTTVMTTPAAAAADMGWTRGTVTEFAGVVTYEGKDVWRLGKPADNPDVPQPPGPNEIMRTFKVTKPVLTFTYNVSTYDYTDYDKFEYVITTEDGEVVHSESMTAWGAVDDTSLKSTGWIKKNVVLSDYMGKNLKIKINCEGTSDDSYPTWAYVDGFALTSFIMIEGPPVVMTEAPFNVTISVLNPTGGYYTGTIHFNCTDPDAKIINISGIAATNLDYGNWRNLTCYTYEFDGAGDGGRKEFTVMMGTNGTTWIRVEDVENEEYKGELKIAVADPVEDEIMLYVDLVPLVRFEVAPGEVDFGKLAPGGGFSDRTIITLYNRGAKDLEITSEVSNEPFVEGIWIAGTFWENFVHELSSDHADFVNTDDVDVALAIPEEYGGAGAGEDIEGTLVFLAEVT